MFFLLIIIQQILRFNAEESNLEGNFHSERRFCMARTSNRFNVSLVELEPGESVLLQCKFCKSFNELSPRVWFSYTNLSNNHSLTEVPIDMDNNPAKNRIVKQPDQSILIKNFTERDSNNYFCMEPSSSKTKFQYFVDATYPVVKSIRGDLKKLLDYKHEFLDSANHELNKSSISHLSNVEFFTYTEWDTEWGPCEVCGRAIGKGERFKNGRCWVEINGGNKLLQYFSCRSIFYGRMLPNVVNLTRQIPDFILVETCTGQCRPDSGNYIGFQTGKSKQYKYKKTLVLKAGDHLTVVCPESSISSKITWRKNGFILESGNLHGQAFLDAKVIVDSFSTLYLQDVTEKESGNYTCVVEKINMQQLKIVVVSGKSIFTEEFTRHLVYITISLLILTLPCYCAGAYIQIKNRKKPPVIAYKRPSELDSDESDFT